MSTVPERLIIKENYHSLGRKANSAQPKQEPDKYFGIYHPKSGKWFSWCYANKDYAEYTLANILKDWDSHPPIKNYNSREQQDLECNFVQSFSHTKITTKTK